MASKAGRADASDDVWTVDSRGVVRTPLSWLTPRARNAFVRLVGESGLEHILKQRKEQSA